MNENPTNPVEQYELGQKHEKGDGVPKNIDTSISWYAKAANQGYAPAQYKLGMIYHKEYGIRQKAIEYLEQAANNKAADKYCALAADELWKAYNYEYEFGNGRKWSDYRLDGTETLDKEKAFTSWKNTINLFKGLGDAESLFRLYELYKDGFSGTVAGTGLRLEDYAEPANIENAGRCLDKAAVLGCAEAQRTLGKAFLRGDDLLRVPKDEDSAAGWFQKSARQGNAYAQTSFGDCFRYGQGVPRDLQSAIYWYTKAAEQNCSDAQYNLGKMHAKGEGVPKDLEKADYWFAKTAENGGSDTQYNLGKMYANGEDVPQNLEKAKHYMALAAEGGYNKEAKKALAKLNKGATSIKDGGCYVATCVYGFYDCPEVWTLRRYRDGKLSKSWFGRLFIRFYYAVSPTVVELFGNKKWFNGVCKPVLNKIVRVLRNSGINNSFYSDM